MANVHAFDLDVELTMGEETELDGDIMNFFSWLALFFYFSLIYRSESSDEQFYSLGK